ncbi:hypothetical protein BDV95DRAFT_477005, partial [Massariosphaeria phaeospora]
QMIIPIEELYLITTVLTKVSILFFLLRIMDRTSSKAFLWSVWAMMAFVVAYGVSCFFAILFTCWPIDAAWNQYRLDWIIQKKKSFKCTNLTVIIIASACISTTQDLLTCILPLLFIRKLKIPQQRKLAVMSVFGIGVIACVFGVLRVVYTALLYRHVLALDFVYDITWKADKTFIFTTLEVNLAMICASAPALRTY